MKQYLTLAAAALLTAACSNDNGGPNDGSPAEIRLSTHIEGQQTAWRAATDIQSTRFDNGEQLAVYIAENVAEGQTFTTTYAQPLRYTADGTDGLTLSTTTPPQQQPFFPANIRGVNIYALYPVPELEGEQRTFTVQADQSGEADYKKSDLMYGLPTQGNPVLHTAPNVTLSFAHLLAKVTVTLTAGTGQPDLDGATVRLRGVVPSTVLTADAKDATLAATGDEPQSITVGTAEAADNLSLSAIVPPQTLAASFIEVKLSGGGVYRSTNLKDGQGLPLSTIALTGGHQHNFTIRVNRTGLDVTASIEEWGAGTTYGGNAWLD